MPCRFAAFLLRPLSTENKNSYPPTASGLTDKVGSVESKPQYKDIAEHLNYHPYHLSAIIKQETGKTLHQYLIYYRLQIAKNYLLTTDYDILDIAWKCGFSSATYFIELFRKNTGTTPKKYRSLQVHTEI